MRGFIFRMAVAMKEAGERRDCGALIWLGLAIRGRL
jgi:hypothetical protein